MNEEIELLNKQSNLLKMQIQEIISNEEDTDEYNERKLSKMKELEMISSKLAEEEKRKRTLEEYNKVCRVTNSLEYSRVKNKPNRNDLINEMKEKREKAKQEFEIFKEIETEYTKIDPVEVPGYIFLNTEIINKYGLCQYINHNSIIGENTTEQLLQNRREWLSIQDDNGQLYYDLFEKLEGQRDYKKCEEANKNYEEFFDNLKTRTLTELQLEIYNNTISLLKEYIDCSVKTKKIKEKFKIVVNNLSILVNETNLEINKYISLKFNIQVPVNMSATSKISREMKYLSLSYNDKLSEYEKNKEDMSTNLKYIDNMKKNLKLSLYEYLQEESKKKVVIVQQGRYFKKWSDLSYDEKIDRLYSFCIYFIKKYLLEPGLIKESCVDEHTTNLKGLLKASFDDKSLKYKNLKWNVKRGVLERISTLKWDDNKGLTYLLDEEPSVINAVKAETKKVISSKTMINKNTEKVINEQIVVFILSRFDNDVKIQELKEECVEQIKLKLKLKRVLKTDKVEIFKRFDEIYQVISNNKN